MAKYEVIAGIYKNGDDESLEEETLLETDDLAEAQELLGDLVCDDAEDEVEEPGEDAVAD